MSDEDEELVAPHGRDDSGVPKAPYGYKDDGNPRKSNRGRRSGSTVAAPPKKNERNVRSSDRPKVRSQKETKAKLMELVADASSSIAKLADTRLVRAKLGEKHSDALIGDAVIIGAVASPVLDGVIMYAERKPGLLAWMDKAEEAVPALLIARGLSAMAAAIIQNHMEPNEDLTHAGRSMVKIQAARYAAALEAEAAALGLVDEPGIPEQRAA